MGETQSVIEIPEELNNHPKIPQKYIYVLELKNNKYYIGKL
jgi:hypothetical protein